MITIKKASRNKLAHTRQPAIHDGPDLAAAPGRLTGGDSEPATGPGMVEHILRWEDDGGLAGGTLPPLPHQAETRTALPADASGDEPA